MRREDRERHGETARRPGEKERPGDPHRTPAQEQAKGTSDQPQTHHPAEHPHGKLPLPD